MSFGGLITSGVLKGKQFNPDGTLRDFQYGALNDGTSMIGGDSAAGNTDAYSPLVTPQKHYAMLARTRYDLTNNLRLTVQLRHSKIWNNTPEWLDSNAGNITIHSDNAFLSPEIKQIMKQAGEDTFMLGRENKDINPPRNIYRNLATQFTVGLKGAFGDDWQWSSYVSHAEQNNLFRDPGFLLNDNWHFAVNSIIDPVTGKPVCKIALDYPDTTCVPIDLFGQGAASQAARDYVVGQRLFDDKTTLNVASITANGPVAQLPAGKAFVAVGLDWRRLGTNQTVGPDAAAGRLRTTSFEPLSGAFHVSEAFGEFNAPLLAGVPGFQHSDIDLATRFSRYSEAGNVWSWKAAAEDEFIHGFRFRASYSRDIRAPNIGELFSGHHTGFDFGTDPFTGKTGRIKIVSGGNPNLKPETSNTFSAGITMAPHGQQGINVSVDYYDIKIKNVIIGPNPFLLFKRCGLEQAAACARIIRFPNGDLNFIQDTNINLDKYSTDGVDIAVSYRKPITLFGHTVTMSSRTLATWVHRFDTSNGLIKSALVGNTGNSFSSLGAPRWRAISFFTLSAARWAGTVRARYVSPSYYDRNQDIVNNRLGGWLVWGLQGSYKFGPSLNWSAFVNVDNLTDRAAPHGTTFSAFYNDIGRYITVGLRYGF
jgi:outer membrane receptor protein involved in Fe transport